MNFSVNRCRRLGRNPKEGFQISWDRSESSAREQIRLPGGRSGSLASSDRQMFQNLTRAQREQFLGLFGGDDDDDDDSDSGSDSGASEEVKEFKQKKLRQQKKAQKLEKENRKLRKNLKKQKKRGRRSRFTDSSGLESYSSDLVADTDSETELEVVRLKQRGRGQIIGIRRDSDDFYRVAFWVIVFAYFTKMVLDGWKQKT